MKKVLITGKSSYIGQSFTNWCSQMNDGAGNEIEIHTTSLRDDTWQQEDWSSFDAILHVAGLAHVDVSHADEQTKQNYYHINRDLTCQAATKAKADGVSQFVFLSSIIIFGDSAPIGKEKVITKDTKPSPANFYGDSKLEAEKGLLELESEDFTITIVRPPFVYGKGSKGNYNRLASLAKKIPLFPNVDNHRSMIHIDNLCELLRLLIIQNKGGIIMPQNATQESTSKMVQTIARVHGKKLHLIPGFGWLLKLMAHATGYVNKVFGNLSYEQELSKIDGIRYQLIDFEKSIRRTELDS